MSLVLKLNHIIGAFLLLSYIRNPGSLDEQIYSCYFGEQYKPNSKNQYLGVLLLCHRLFWGLAKQKSIHSVQGTQDQCIDITEVQLDKPKSFTVVTQRNMSNRFLTGVENDSKTSVSSRPFLAWMAPGNLEKRWQIAKQI